MDCEVLDNITLTLRYQATKRGLAGFIPPSLISLHGTQRIFLPTNLQVPLNSCGANLHNIANLYYVVSYKDFLPNGNPRITVLDSLLPIVGQNISPEFMAQLDALYGSATIDRAVIRVLCPQPQALNSNDCGLHSLANLIALKDGLDPCLYQF